VALLSERQQKAEQLARELRKLEGVWVSSPLPLDDSAKLRIQVLDSRKNEVIELVCGWGFIPAFCGPLPRVTYTGLLAASLFDIDLPRERTPIHQDDRTIRPAELASDKRENTPLEVVQMRKYLG
jgi:hypothetical protein